jgi:hypothetical protein
MVKGMSEAQIERYVGPVARAILAEVAACEERSREAELAMYLAGGDDEKHDEKHRLVGSVLQSAWCAWVANGFEPVAWAARFGFPADQDGAELAAALRGLEERIATEARRVAERDAHGNFDPATGLGEP